MKNEKTKGHVVRNVRLNKKTLKYTSKNVNSSNLDITSGCRNVGNIKVELNDVKRKGLTRHEERD